jgi:hypothetical protein
MRWRTVAWCFVVVLLAAFPLGAADVPPGDEIVLGVGESVVLPHGGIRIGFEGVFGDSRCPAGVECFWAGDAPTHLWIREPFKERVEFVLHTHRSFIHSITYGDLKVTLLGVEPYPSVDNPPIGADDYVVTMQIEGASVPLGTNGATWGGIKALYDRDP